MSSRSRRFGALLAIFVTTIVVACNGGTDDATRNTTPTPSAPRLPQPLFSNYPAVANDFRFHWSAASGIDLATGPAVPLRAYLESMRLAAFTGGDPTVVYPGFMRATPENQPILGAGDPFQLQFVRPKTRAQYEANGWKYVERQVYGYQPTHILSLDEQGDGYRATLCLGAYSVYRPTLDDPKKFVSTAADDSTGAIRSDGRDMVQVWRIELSDRDSRAVDPPSAMSQPQIGPLPAPVNDVFGKWFITGTSQGQLWGPSGQGEDVETPELRQQCEAAMPDDAATRGAMATGFHDAPPPHGDPIPGWPAASG